MLEGAAPDIVCLHGLGVSSRYFVRSLRTLGPFSNVYAPDLPGSGRSDKPHDAPTIPALADAAIAWMDAAGLSRASLLGNSFGCQVAVDLAVRHPTRVDRLILVGPTMDAKHRQAAAQFARWLVNAVVEPVSIVPPLVADYLDCGMRRTLQLFRYALTDAIEAKLPAVKAPTLVVRGARDVIVPQRWAEEVVRLLPDARLEVVPRGAHVVNWDSADELALLTRRFLEES